MRRSRPYSPAPPLIGVVTHELRGEAEPAWAPVPGRRARDLAPHRLSLRLTYTQAVQEAGGIAVARFCLGVQWHAEVLTHRSEHAPLFASLIAAAPGAAPALALAA